MPRTVRVVFGLPILFTTVTKTWRALIYVSIPARATFASCRFLPTAGSFAWRGLHTNKDNWSVTRVWITKYKKTFSKIVWIIYAKHTTWISRVSLRGAPSSSFCSLSFLPNGNHTRLQNLPWQQIANIFRNFCLCIHFFTEVRSHELI